MLNQSSNPVTAAAPEQNQAEPQNNERLIAMLLQQMQGQNNVQTQGITIENFCLNFNPGAAGCTKN